MTRFAALAIALAATSTPSLASPEFQPRARLQTSVMYDSGPSSEASGFALDALELGLEARIGPALSLDVQLDAVRSASPDSLFGIADNALIPLVRRAYGTLSLPLPLGRLELSLGLLPDPVVTQIEAIDLRHIANALADTGGFLPRSDLGAQLAWRTSRMRLCIAMTNGEGGQDVERDDQRDVMASLGLTPFVLAGLGGEARLDVGVAGRLGSRGPGALRHDSASLWAALSSPRLSLGLEAHLAGGHLERPANALGLSAVASVGVLLGLDLTVRYDWLDLDTDVASSDLTLLDLGLTLTPGRLLASRDPDLAALEDHLRLRLAWRHRAAGALTAPTPSWADSGSADTFLVSLVVSFPSPTSGR